ncbi:MAG: thiamine-monophosphate kinase [Bradymonadia bacterium]
MISTDTLVEGVHFDRARDTPAQIGAQAAVANLSDLAASGGAPGWMVWSLVLDWSAADLSALTQGFAEVATANGAQIVGGNLSRGVGPAVIAVTVGGPLAGARAWHRADAAPGHGIYVTGSLGDAALGYLDDDAEARQVRHCWRPHLSEAALLADWGGVGGAMDVSDGLAIDAHRMARAADVALHFDGDRIPLSEHYRARRADLSVALTGGEDYVLLFTAAERPPIGTRVGTCRAGAGVFLDGALLPTTGWDHFGP